MNVVKCSNGHFFDCDKYPACPHCGAPSSASQQAPANTAAPKKKLPFGWKSKEAAQPQQPAGGFQPRENGYGGAPAGNGYACAPAANGFGSAPAQNFNPIPFGDGNSETVGLTANQVQKTPTGSKKVVTLDFWQTGSPETPEPAGNMPAEPAPAAPVRQPEPEPAEIPAPAPKEEPAPQQSSLLEKVRNASANSEGKTMSYFNAFTEKAQAGPAKPAAHIDPVVGWLVCISGAHFGESFHIAAGMNSIGRNEDNRIVLSRDQSVSRDKHAFITYEPKHRQFYMKPGDSSGLTYVNDEYLTETKRIEARSIIELGSSRFIFVPLCGPDFTWEDYLKP